MLAPLAILDCRFTVSSTNGRRAAFESEADDLSPLDSNGAAEVFAARVAAPSIIELPDLSTAGHLLLAAGLLTVGGWLLRRVAA